ncbi:hypothetical protein FAZ69_25630 [Trinickia terrae]|uniref:Uncharacterized protein n=1 Tax=Trinickia terrae TaxID=2571161 RepID=A0A4U1HSG6_9BURK|nr:hypothetical protein [Trinickia terrae]TKC83078.1 hypothetical protein FAZ69_25630 [Trinickia terrae]
MARPRIGIFGALVAVGGMLAWRWAQKHRASQTRLAQDLSRWENEGGAVAASTQTAPMPVPPKPAAGGESGAKALRSGAGSEPGVWHFPHG